MSASNNLWPENVSATRFLLSGAILEFVGNGILYPFYYCKTHLQTNINPLTGHGNPFVHLIKQAQAITAQNGIKGLYRGYLWSTCGSFPGIIIHISVYTSAKYQLSYDELNVTHNLFSHSMNHKSDNSDTQHVHRSPYNSLIPMISGLIAETCAVLCFVPQEVVAQRLQLSPTDTKLFDIIKTIYYENGMRSFWRGTFAAYASYLPSSGIWWGSYEGYKHLICRKKEMQNLFGYSIAGVFGGVTTAMFTNPIDVIRTRIQTQKGTYGSTKIMRVVSNLYKNEGIFAFSKGLGARIALLVLEGILFADFYEIMMYFSTIKSQ
eukprot:11899_1